VSYDKDRCTRGSKTSRAHLDNVPPAAQQRVAADVGRAAAILIWRFLPPHAAEPKRWALGTLVMIFAGVTALPADFISSLSYSQAMFLFMAAIAVLDAILLGLSVLSFKRSRLIVS